MAKLTYTNSRGESIAMGRKTNYFVTNIDGFSNVINIINSIKSPNQDGATEVNSTLDSRHLTIEGEFLQAERQRGRNKLIQTFNPKLSGYLKYENQGVIKQIACRPESVPIISTSTLATVPFIINLFAANPYWQDVTESKTEISTETGNFEFPLEIPPEGLELSIRTISFITNIYNQGDVDTPIKVKLKAVGTVINPIIENLDTGEFIRIKRTLAEGETLEINTAFGNKRVEVIQPNGSRENVFHYIDYKSTFFSLEGGDNTIKYDAEVGENNLDVSIYYTPNYLGV